jgi:hypothetical protein
MGPDLDRGAVGVVVDPQNHDVLYSGSLYGPNGLFKSTNGGVDWKQIFTPDVLPFIPYGGFLGGIAMDHANSQHLVVTWHAECAAPYNKACYAETFDAGAHWVLRNGLSTWAGGEGTRMAILDDGVWLFSSESNGLWRSKNSGQDWVKIDVAGIAHSGGQLYRLRAGVFYFGASNGVLFTEDNGDTFKLLPNSGYLISGVTGDGVHVWSSQSFPYNPPRPTDKRVMYWASAAASPMAWAPAPQFPLIEGGGYLAYDADHHLLYSANYWLGVFRIRLE